MNKYEKYVLPWKKTNRPRIQYEREYLVCDREKLIIGVQPPILIYSREHLGRLEWIELFYPDKAYKTWQAAMVAVDNRLQENGYTFLNEKQAERLRLLI